jgi:ribosomal protein S4E
VISQRSPRYLPREESKKQGVSGGKHAGRSGRIKTKTKQNKTLVVLLL